MMPQLWRLDRNLGAVSAPTVALGMTAEYAVPEGFTASAVNVRLSESRFLHPRQGLLAVSTSGGPTASIRYVYVERIAGAEAIWTVTGTAPLTAYRSNVAVTLSDTTADGDPVFCAYNGKVFMAYDSNVNRLHVYDPTLAVPAVRRVGIEAPVAATAANGGGAGVAVIRYYKIQMRLHVSADSSRPRVATSELGPVVSFTPAANGVTVTKPATVDSATHWTVYGSSDGITYYDISGSQAVGTTTWLDNLTPANYAAASAGVAPEVGLFVPPPSCKFLVTNGERLIMAGAWETTATALQTTPTPRRVWFTRPLGVTDEGDDEAVTQTSANRYYLDIDVPDGSEITGLSATADGSVYAFTETTVWRLTDTGATDTPFRADLVSAGIGAAANAGIVAVNAAAAVVGVYFMSPLGPYRYSPGSGLEWLGEDWVVPGQTLSSPQAFTYVGGFDPAQREVTWATTTVNGAKVLRIDLVRQVGSHLRGGWSDNAYAQGSGSSSNVKIRSMAVYQKKLLVAGTALDGGDMLATTTTSANDLGETFDAEVVTPMLTFGGMSRHGATDEPYVWKHKTATVTLALTGNYGGADNLAVSDTAAAVAITGGDARRHMVKVEGLVSADVYGVRLRATISGANHGVPCDAVIVPYTTREPA